LENEEKLINISCPICKKSNKIKVPISILSQKSFGAIKIQVPIGACCPDHYFIAYVDSNGNVRGYEKIDIYMTTKQDIDKEKEDKLTIRKLFDIFGMYGVLNLLHAKIFNYPTYILIDDDFNYPEYLFNSYFDRVIPERFRGDKNIQLIKKSKYDGYKFNEKGLIIDSHQNILQTPWIERLKFEESLINKVTEIIDGEEQLYVIQQNVSKFIDEVIHVVNEILPNVDAINEKDLIKTVTTDLKLTKKDKTRIKLIKTFIKRRISPELASKIQK